MERQLKRTYSEVYSILQMLGESFINKLPTNLYSMIEEEKLEEYSPTYSLDIALDEQNVKKESLAMIALFHSTYWCDSKEEIKQLKEVFLKAEKKKYENNAENLNFNDLTGNKDRVIDEADITDDNIETESIEIKRQENSIIKKIINKIKTFFKRN